MGMDQWRSENDSGGPLAPIWSAKPASTGQREQAESRKTDKTDRRPTGVHVIGVNQFLKNQRRS